MSSVSQRLSPHIIALAAAASHLCLAVPAVAQETGAGDEAARGMRTGSFLLYPELVLNGGFSDNLDESAGAPDSGTLFEVSPSLTLASDWNRHALNASLAGTFSAHDGDWDRGGHVLDALISARVDVYRSSYLTLSGGYAREAEPGIRDNLYSLEAAYSHTFNRLTLTPRVGVSFYDYGGDRAGAGSATEAAVSDYRETAGGLRASYEISPATTVFVEGGVNRRDFDQPIDTNGFRRGSDGYGVAAGMSWSNGSKLSAEVALGYEHQDPDDPALAPVGGVTLDGLVTWQMTPLTTLSATAATGTGETVLAGSAGYVSRRAGLEVSHALRRHVILAGGVTYERADFAGVSLVEETTEARAAIDYLLSPHMAVTAELRHTDFNSTAAASDWDANTYLVGLKFRR